MSLMEPTVAGYLRLSISQDTSVSIDAQRGIVERWAAAHSRAITIYTDDGFSGSKDIERPAYDRMLHAIAHGEHDAVVVKSIDRLGRQLKGFIDLADKIRIVTVEGGIDTGTPTGRMMLSLLSTFAEFEANQMGQRQTTSQAYRRKAGRAVGAPSFGYINVQRDDGTYRIIDQEEGLIVREMVDKILTGASIRSIADWLNEQGIKTKQGKTWSASTVSQVTSNPAIAGLRQSKGDFIRDEDGLPIIDEHLAIISMFELQQLEDAKKQRATFMPNTRLHDRLLLHGIAHCASCGGYMTRGSVTIRGKKYPDYRCTQGNHSKCPARTTISQRKLDGYIEEQLAPLMGAPVYAIGAIADSDAIQRKALLEQDIKAAAASMTEIDPSLIPEVAVTIGKLREQIDAISTLGELVPMPTGETFAQLWVRDPQLVVRQAIKAVYVKPAGRGNTRSSVSDRVHIDWHDEQEY